MSNIEFLCFRLIWRIPIIKSFEVTPKTNINDMNNN